MIQRFATPHVAGRLVVESRAELMYVCKANAGDTRLPRAMHKHDDHVEIVLIVEGQGAHIIDGQEYRTRKGDLLVYNSGVLHDESSFLDSGMAIYCCAFRGFKLKGLSANHLIPPQASPVVHSGAFHAELKNLFQILYAQVGTDHKTAPELCWHLLQALILLVLRLITRESPKLEARSPSLGECIKTYIDDHYAETIELQSMADRLKISPYYLARKFKAHTGQSPIQYVIRRRIGEAQSLLINSGSSIAEVALAVGYGDPNYFTTVFKRVVGIPPGQYRKQYLDG